MAIGIAFAAAYMWKLTLLFNHMKLRHNEVWMKSGQLGIRNLIGNSASVDIERLLDSRNTEVSNDQIVSTLTRQISVLRKILNVFAWGIPLVMLLAIASAKLM